MSKVFLRIYLPILIIVASIFFSFGFVLSQGPPTFSQNQPTTNAWHAANEIWCDGCLRDANVANNANIGVRKINGANGLLFSSDVLGTGYKRIPDSVSAYLSNWNGAVVELLCDPTVDNSLRAYAGLTQIGGSLYRWNHNVVTLSNSIPQVVYRAESGLGSFQFEFKVCANIAECNDGTNVNHKLMVRKVITGTSPENSAFIECQLKILSLCGGQAVCPP